MDEIFAIDKFLHSINMPVMGPETKYKNDIALESAVEGTSLKDLSRQAIAEKDDVDMSSSLHV